MMESFVATQNPKVGSVGGPVRSGRVQRKCACGEHTLGGGECSSCREKREQTLQRSVTNRTSPGVAPPIVYEVLHSPGQPLDRETRSFMEPRFGHDFSRVRVHNSPKAAESARTVNALAYTVGQDLVFDSGRYAPGTGEGRKLLAHELAHAVQQGGSADPAPRHLTVGLRGDSSEVEADRIADRISAGADTVGMTLLGSSSTLRRVCGPTEISSVDGCLGLSGDISGENFLFRVNCDDFQPGEEARLRSFAYTLNPQDIIEIHGFASEEGDPSFNDDLSCQRAKKAMKVLLDTGTAAWVGNLYKHGATTGPRPERRSVVIDKRPEPSKPRQPRPLRLLHSSSAGQTFLPRSKLRQTKPGQLLPGGPPQTSRRPAMR